MKIKLVMGLVTLGLSAHAFAFDWGSRAIQIEQRSTDGPVRWIAEDPIPLNHGMSIFGKAIGNPDIRVTMPSVVVDGQIATEAQLEVTCGDDSGPDIPLLVVTFNEKTVRKPWTEVRSSPCGMWRFTLVDTAKALHAPQTEAALPVPDEPPSSPDSAMVFDLKAPGCVVKGPDGKILKLAEKNGGIFIPRGTSFDSCFVPRTALDRSPASGGVQIAAMERKPDILRNQMFLCAPPLKKEQAAVITRPDGEAVSCVTVQDVRSAIGNELAIPKGSRFSGYKDGRYIAWVSWITPQHHSVNVKEQSPLEMAAFVSRIDPDAEVYAVVANRSIAVPGDARH